MSTRADVAAAAVASVLGAVLGLVTGVAGSFLQESRPGGLPAGLVAGLVASGAAVVLAGSLTRSLVPSLVTPLAWAAAALPLAAARPEGDVVVPGDTIGYCWAYGGMLVVGLCAVVNVSGTLRKRPSAEGRPPLT
ncbi:DUF6113 family protein [Motilibacter aurantiacus]|uniref:DUF6113 family protein n=1 Tax=Motilibacter aurantiacus TaxID=2714955 RepID=UPI001409227D|nr:hypothetical protein [Motilibacter aurantiacus]